MDLGQLYYAESKYGSERHRRRIAIVTWSQFPNVIVEEQSEAILAYFAVVMRKRERPVCKTPWHSQCDSSHLA